MKFFNRVFAFSLVEILVALVIVSLIMAAAAPVITKKLTSSAVTIGGGGGLGELTSDCSKFGSSCGLCYEKKCVSCVKSCRENEALDIENCDCVTCASKHSDACLKCDIENCTKCNNEYEIIDGKCSNCPDGKYCDGAINYSCPIGHYCENGIKTQCPQNTYTDVENSTSCLENTAANCSARSTTSNTCTSCNAGYGYSSGVCTACASGTYSSGGTMACTSSTTVANCSTYSTTSNQCTACNSGYDLSSNTCKSKVFTFKYTGSQNEERSATKHKIWLKSSGTFTANTSGTATIFLVGGGGNGGQYAGSGPKGCGGGGGYTTKATYSFTAGKAIAVTVGGAGGQTKFDYLTANGGGHSNGPSPGVGGTRGGNKNEKGEDGTMFDGIYYGGGGGGTDAPGGKGGGGNGGWNQATAGVTNSGGGGGGSVGIAGGGGSGVIIMLIDL